MVHRRVPPPERKDPGGMAAADPRQASLPRVCRRPVGECGHCEGKKSMPGLESDYAPDHNAAAPADFQRCSLAALQIARPAELRSTQLSNPAVHLVVANRTFERTCDQSRVVHAWSGGQRLQ